MEKWKEEFFQEFLNYISLKFFDDRIATLVE